MPEIPATFLSGKPRSRPEPSPIRRFCSECVLCGKPLVPGGQRYFTVGAENGWPLAWHTPTENTTCVAGVNPTPVTLVALKPGDHILGPSGTPMLVHECKKIREPGQPPHYRLRTGSSAPVYLDNAHFFFVPDPDSLARLKADASAKPTDLLPADGYLFPTHDSLRISPSRIDRLTPVQFEQFVSALLERAHCAITRRGGRSNDMAADVLATTQDGVYLAVQCKHTQVGRKVDAPTMYEVNGTAGPEHGARVALVVTNGGFTKPALAFAERHEILTVGRDDLAKWANGTLTLADILSNSTPSR
ncbi:restriction endonuclease [Kitasatospora sp. NBC_01287]|uniref:restriction endonuclease n=1 Tax=Kitasatospora sp. NBC_01287 TaxID=2903573 RepID=UPI002257EF02|nr:restriction endonuclease [Kitasatospora sp. NBC_01287]MCX4748088.1 restriction endonuclease [Kitasatospora sp. NBC_01287]